MDLIKSEEENNFYSTEVLALDIPCGSTSATTDPCTNMWIGASKGRHTGWRRDDDGTSLGRVVKFRVSRPWTKSGPWHKLDLGIN